MKIATAEATANIALVKYWGKRDEKLILPQQGSLSVTMDETLKTRTTVLFSKNLREDEIWLDGKKLNLKDKEIKEKLQQLEIIRKMAKIKDKARIVSINCFPTGAGFASSAAGLAALALAASKAAGLNLSLKELSILARLGSGSACRSVFGGFVEWKRGKKEDGSDSFAVQIAPPEHWPQLRNIIAIVSPKKKKIPSRIAMRQTVATSILYKARLEYLPGLIKRMKKAILEKDFQTLAELTMRESNNLHSVMLDTFPPIIYLTDVSKEIIFKVHEINEKEGKYIAAYTFDAGPQAHIFTLENYVPKIKKVLSQIKGIKKFLICKVGKGPKYIEDEKEFLIDPKTGKIRKHYYDKRKNKIVILK